MKLSPDSRTTEALKSVWRRVLEQPSVGLDDNFFDLGGDPASAVKLFTEISHECGRELSPLFIYQAPTISALAALLEQPSPPRLRPVALLKTGNSQPPVFITHGLAGDLMQLFELMKHIQSAHAVYGLHAPGMDGLDRPFERIEDIARLYIDSVKGLQPHGPYCLMGYSFGGLVMLEMAQRLSDSGEEIGLLAMLDSYPHVRYLPLRQRGRLWMRRTRGRTSAISRSVRSRSPLQNLRAVGRRLQNLPDRRPGKTHRTLNNSVTAAMDRVTDSGFLALKHYRPRHYGGSILFIQAEDLTGFPDNPAAVWGQFVEKLEVKTVPGSHTRMLSAHAASLGCVLSHYLAEALPCEGRQARM